MAVTFVDSTSACHNAATSLEVTAPSGIADGDILVAYGYSYETDGEVITPPSGFAEWTTYNVGAAHKHYLWWKRCSSESGTYTLTTTNNCTFHAHIVALRGCLATGDPEDVESTGAYGTSDTIVRAATMTTTAPGAQIWGGFCVRDPSVGLAVPAAFTTAETTQHASADTYRCSSGYRLDAANTTWGATDNQDGTVSSGATTTKNAMMVSVKAAPETFTGMRVTHHITA